MSRLVLIFVTLICLSSTGLALRASPLKPSAKDDFEGLKFALFDEPSAEGWLCPYQYLPVPLDRKNPKLLTVLSNLTQLFDSQFNFSKYAASAVLTYRGDILWEWAYGTDPHTQKKVTSDSVFRIGSLSKVFPALLGLVAETLGIVNLDDPVKKYVPELEMIDPFHSESDLKRRSSFSWRQLATHTSGLQREAPCTYHSCQRSTIEILQRLKNSRLILPAAGKPSYSNLGYAMMGHFLAHVMKQDYASLVHSHFLAPLGMSNTSFTTPTHYVPPVPLAPLYDLGWLAPSGQMFSTSKDLAKLAIAINMASSDRYLLGNPRFSSSAANGRQKRSEDEKYENPFAKVLEIAKSEFAIRHLEHKYEKKSASKMEKRIQPSENIQENYKHNAQNTSTSSLGIFNSLLREAMFPTFRNGDGTGYGMPWEMYPVGQYLVRNKGGNLQGYSSDIAIVPELQLGMTITTNFATDASLWATHNLAQFIPEFEQLLDPLQSMPPTPDQVSRYVGTYESSTEISVNFFGYLAITKLKGLNADIPLVVSRAEPHNPAILQIYVPQAGLPCMSYEFAALAYQYVEFEFDQKGVATSFRIPGLMWADTFVKSNP